MSFKIIFFCFFLLVPVLLPAQQDTLSRIERLRLTEQHLNDLKNGVLIVRLKTERNKLNALTELKEKSSNIEYKKRLQAKIDMVKMDRDTLNLATIRAFTEHFDYSKDIYFMPDTLAPKLFDNIETGIFVNTNLEIDESINITGRNVYLTYVGIPPNSSGKTSFIITDRNGKILPSPFPFAVNYYTFFSFVNFGKKDDFFMEKAVIRLNERLNKRN